MAPDSPPRVWSAWSVLAGGLLFGFLAGIRTLQGAWLVLAMGGVMVGVGMLGVRGWRWVRGMGAGEKPTWWLIRLDLKSKTAGVADAAFDELLRRSLREELSASQTEPIIDRILAAKADANVAWVEGWQEVVAHARAAGKVDDARWRQYWAGVFEIELMPGVEIDFLDVAVFILQLNELLVRVDR